MSDVVVIDFGGVRGLVLDELDGETRFEVNIVGSVRMLCFFFEL